MLGAFARSPLGAFVRSPLGARVTHVGGGYIWGGAAWSSPRYLSDNDCYRSDTWSTKEELSPARRSSSAFQLLGAGYVCGGSTVAASRVRDVDQYLSDTWTPMTDIPVPARMSAAASAIESAGYLFYGAEEGVHVLLNDCDEYVPDGWTPKTSGLSPARSSPGVSMISGSIYLYGGLKDGGSPISIDDCDRYTPAGDNWDEKTSMPYPPRHAAVASTVGGKGIVACGRHLSGGVPPSYEILRDTDSYDPVGDAWSPEEDVPLPPRDYAAGFALGLAAYIVGGSTGSAYLRDTDRFEAEAWTSGSELLSPGRAFSSGVAI